MRERVVIGDEDVEAWRARQVADGLDPEEVLTLGWADWMAGAKGRVGKRVEEIERVQEKAMNECGRRGRSDATK